MSLTETIAAEKYVREYDSCTTSDNQRRRVRLIMEEIQTIIEDSENPGSILNPQKIHLVYDPSTISTREETRIKHKLAEIDTILKDGSI